MVNITTNSEKDPMIVKQPATIAAEGKEFGTESVESGEPSMNMYEDSFGQFKEGEVVSGVITAVDKDLVLVDLERMRMAVFLPKVADRESRPQWQEKGSPDSQVHALKQVREILTQENPAVFSSEVDARIRSEFKDLVPGNSVPPSR